MLTNQIKNSHIETFSDAKHFVDYINQDEPKLNEFYCIVSDYDMPNMNGEDLYLELKNKMMVKRFIMFSGRYTNNRFPEIQVVSKPNVNELVEAILN